MSARDDNQNAPSTSSEVGISPEEYLSFDQFCKRLELKGDVPDLLLASLKSDSEFLELTTQQRFFYGRTGIKHLGSIKDKVAVANRNDSKRQDGKRKKTKRKKPKR